MADNFAAIAELLSCPDDGASLRLIYKALCCNRCDRRFPIHEDNLAEILPSRPVELHASVNSGYREGYLRTFKQPFHLSETSRAWGAEETVATSWARKRHRQVAMVKPLVTKGISVHEAVLCDISAGAGYYTFEYANAFRFVLHCDLSVDNLTYAWRKARGRGIRNIVFLRADYFALPFRQTLDRILCFDTLIRGEAHDSALLSSIVRSLKPSGCAVVDFHNWWHNPLRRLGLLPENFHANQSYVRSVAEKLIRNTGITEFSYWPFFQEIGSPANSDILRHFLPATRLVYCLTAPRLDASSYEITSDQTSWRDADAARL